MSWIGITCKVLDIWPQKCQGGSTFALRKNNIPWCLPCSRKGWYHCNGPFVIAYSSINRWDGFIIPPQFFQKARTASWLFAHLFFFDSFSQYSTRSDIEYWEKLSKFFATFFALPEPCVIKEKKAEKFTKSSHFGNAWYLCRGPPRKSEPVFNHIQVFGGKQWTSPIKFK